MTTETFISVDIEADGPIPGDYSMLSLGAAAFDSEGNMLSTFYVNIEPLPEATTDPDTMRWWTTQIHAWAACQKNRVTPVEAMHEYVLWLSKYTNPVFIAWPLSFEAMFLGHYMWKYALKHPFNYRWVDVNTYAAATMKCDFKDAIKNNFPKRWSVADKHTHIAWEDAVAQGRIFMKIVREVRGD